MATMEHPAYVEQMLLSSPSPNHSEPQAEKEKETINNQTDLQSEREDGSGHQEHRLSCSYALFR